jgi:hypothetical protein
MFWRFGGSQSQDGMARTGPDHGRILPPDREGWWIPKYLADAHREIKTFRMG